MTATVNNYQVFKVLIPPHYTVADRTVFRDSIQQALEAITRDAHMDVESARLNRITDV